MKKALSICLALVIIALSASVALGANYNGFVYTANEDGTYTITGYNDFHTDVVNVPEKINGVKVTAIGSGAFQTKANITTVKIPDTITSIGAMAFYGCKKLNSVVMGNGVISIGSKAFNSCTALTSIHLKNVQIVGEYAFYGCTALEEINCGGSLKVIGKHAFNKCAAVTKLKLCETLLYIDDYAFAGNIGLTALTLPDSLGYIGNSAFKGCTALTSVEFGSGDLEIAGYAFESCSALTQIDIPDNVIKIGRYAFALRETYSTDFTHNIAINCSSTSAAVIYAKNNRLTATVDGIEYSFSNFGDYNGDGKVTTKDANALLRVSASIDPTPDQSVIINCDINNNNMIDTMDIRNVLSIAAGLV